MSGLLLGTGEYGCDELGDAGVLGFLQPALQLVPQHGDKLLLAQGSVTVLNRFLKAIGAMSLSPRLIFWEFFIPCMFCVPWMEHP